MFGFGIAMLYALWGIYGKNMQASTCIVRAAQFLAYWYVLCGTVFFTVQNLVAMKVLPKEGFLDKCLTRALPLREIESSNLFISALILVKFTLMTVGSLLIFSSGKDEIPLLHFDMAALVTGAVFIISGEVIERLSSPRT